MQQNFFQSTQWMLIHEGGYVNHPKDPGGATNRGVTQRVYDGYRGRTGSTTQSVRSITMDEVQQIYREQYWDKVWGDHLPDGIDYAVYDFSVNSGPSRAVKFIQRMVGVAADGVMGSVTLAAINAVNDRQSLIERLCEQRLSWMKTLKTFKTFGRGWTRRVMGEVPGAQPGSDTGVVDRGVKLHQGVMAKDIAVPTAAIPGRALEEDIKLSSSIHQAAGTPTAVVSGVAGSVPGLLSAASMAPEGPIQWAIGIALVMLVGVVGLIAYRKFG